MFWSRLRNAKLVKFVRYILPIGYTSVSFGSAIASLTEKPVKPVPELVEPVFVPVSFPLGYLTLSILSSNYIIWFCSC